MRLFCAHEMGSYTAMDSLERLAAGAGCVDTVQVLVGDADEGRPSG